MSNGLYPVQTAQCEEPYSGPHAGRSVYIVGYGTENEQFFTRGDRTAAIRTARELDATIDHLPANQLCAEVVESLFG
jgi:hypothetical protein